MEDLDGGRVMKDSAFFRSAIVRALHRTKAKANEGSTLQDYSFIGELIPQVSRKAFREAIGATSRQGIYLRLQAQC